MSRILLAGAGRVGRAIALDLAPEHDVTVIDPSREALAGLDGVSNVQTVRGDCGDRELLGSLAGGHDLAIGAVPGFAGFDVLSGFLEAGLAAVDISFSPQDPFALSELARRQGVAAVVDCGVAPGLCNLFLGYTSERFAVREYRCLVGGLPREHEPPFHYKAPFSPIDVLEEYIRPARLVRRGEILERPALTDPEVIDWEGLGSLEAFNTDGLRTLLTTLRVETMTEKTLRYPGHREAIEELRDSGLLETEAVDVAGTQLRPIDVTARVLLPRWELADGELEFTVMRVEISGESERWTFDLFDETDVSSGLTSMARTTGFTCTAVARLLLEGPLLEPGIWAPEHLGACYDRIRSQLEKRGVRWTVSRDSDFCYPL